MGDAPRQIGSYRILRRVGKGGMGEVFVAHDEKLDRDVALKILPVADAHNRARFAREARAAAGLNHPNIVTIHSVEEDGERPFLTMELIEGNTLSAEIPDDGMPLERFNDLAPQIGEALQAAHAAGITHRDLKPDNIMVTADGRIKVLDFGLAKIAKRDSDDETRTQGMTLTSQGQVVGTIAYMSPEQASGKPVDERSDIFALGLVLHQMLTGQRAFHGDSPAELVSSILRDPVTRADTLRSEVPSRLGKVVERCLQKQPEDRYASVAELLEAMQEGQRPVMAPGRNRVWVAAALIALVAVIAVWLWRGDNTAAEELRVVEAMEAALSEQKALAAFVLGRDARHESARIQALFQRSVIPIEITSEPAGARFEVRPFGSADESWVLLGETPMAAQPFPAEELHWRATLDGHAPVEGVHVPWGGDLQIEFHPTDSVPEEMVWIPAGTFAYDEGSVDLPGFWIDRFEVSQQRYQAFVEAGGYDGLEGRDYVDATGRPGPASWRLSAFGEGEGDLPVSGISWDEARAFCLWEDKQLPTVFHWKLAARTPGTAKILTLSNFNSSGTVPVGSQMTMASWGTYDMAGNVQEWIQNHVGEQRVVLGGGWNQPEYLFEGDNAAHPTTRDPSIGMRCMRTEGPLPEELLGPLPNLRHDFNGVTPIDDELYAALVSQYSYDKNDFEGESLGTLESEGPYIVEKVRYPAPYGGESIPARMYLPRDREPPYQAVVYFPGSTARQLASSDNLPESSFFEFVPASGRALIYPVYQRTYERGGGESLGGMSGVRDTLVDWGKDVSRTVDYLESRPDIDSENISLVGLSMGGIYAPIFAALEPRFKSIVIIGGGLHDGMQDYPPEIDPVNFASRVHTPTLMITGKHDFLRPVELGQRPLFDLIAVDDQDKRLAILEGGHIPEWDDVIRETLDWLDRYMPPGD